MPQQLLSMIAGTVCSGKGKLKRWGNIGKEKLERIKRRSPRTKCYCASVSCGSWLFIGQKKILRIILFNQRPAGLQHFFGILTNTMITKKILYLFHVFVSHFSG